MVPSSSPQTPDKKPSSIHPPRRRRGRRRSNKHSARSSSLELRDDEYAFGNTLDEDGDKFRQPRRALSFARPKPAPTKSSNKADDDDRHGQIPLVNTKTETESTTGQGNRGDRDFHVKREPSAKAKPQALPTTNHDNHVKPSSIETSGLVSAHVKPSSVESSKLASGEKLSTQSPQVVTPDEHNGKRKGDEDDDALVDTSDDDDDDKSDRPQRTKCRSSARHTKKKPRFRVVYRTDENGNLVRQRVDAQTEYGLFDSKDDEDNNDSGELDLDTDPGESDTDQGPKKGRSPKVPPGSHVNIQSTVENLVDQDIPPMLSAEEQEKALNGIKEPHDVALQAVLFHEKFCFVLKRYQFLAVRRMAGLPLLFPLHCGSRVCEPRKATMPDAKFGLNRQENVCRTRGILCADEMVSRHSKVLIHSRVSYSETTNSLLWLYRTIVQRGWGKLSSQLLRQFFGMLGELPSEKKSVRRLL